MDPYEVQSLQVGARLLRENVDVAPLLPVLLKDSVIGEDDLWLVNSGSTRQEKAKLLFENVLLERRCEGFCSVIHALRQSNQRDIADILAVIYCARKTIFKDLPKDFLRNVTMKEDEADQVVHGVIQTFIMCLDDTVQHLFQTLLLENSYKTRLEILLTLRKLKQKMRKLEQLSLRYEVMARDRGGHGTISLLQFIMHTSEVRKLQRMGFKRRTLKTVIKHQLEKTGQWFSSFEDIYESAVHFTDNGCCIDPSCRRRTPSRTFITACVSKLEFAYDV